MSENEVCHDREGPEFVEENPPIQKMLKVDDSQKCEAIQNLVLNEYGRKFIYVSPETCNPLLYVYN